MRNIMLLFALLIVNVVGLKMRLTMDKKETAKSRPTTDGEKTRDAFHFDIFLQISKEESKINDKRAEDLFKSFKNDLWRKEGSVQSNKDAWLEGIENSEEKQICSKALDAYLKIYGAKIEEMDKNFSEEATTEESVPSSSSPTSEDIRDWLSKITNKKEQEIYIKAYNNYLKNFNIQQPPVSQVEVDTEDDKHAFWVALDKSIKSELSGDELEKSAKTNKIFEFFTTTRGNQINSGNFWTDRWYNHYKTKLGQREIESWVSSQDEKNKTIWRKAFKVYLEKYPVTNPVSPVSEAARDPVFSPKVVYSVVAPTPTGSVTPSVVEPAATPVSVSSSSNTDGGRWKMFNIFSWFNFKRIRIPVSFSWFCMSWN